MVNLKAVYLCFVVRFVAHSPSRVIPGRIQAEQRSQRLRSTELIRNLIGPGSKSRLARVEPVRTAPRSVFPTASIKWLSDAETYVKTVERMSARWPTAPRPDLPFSVDPKLAMSDLIVEDKASAGPSATICCSYRLIGCCLFDAPRGDHGKTETQAATGPGPGPVASPVSAVCPAGRDCRTCGAPSHQRCQDAWQYGGRGLSSSHVLPAPPLCGPHLLGLERKQVNTVVENVQQLLQDAESEWMTSRCKSFKKQIGRAHV